MRMEIVVKSVMMLVLLVKVQIILTAIIAQVVISIIMVLVTDNVLKVIMEIVCFVLNVIPHVQHVLVPLSLFIFHNKK